MKLFKAATTMCFTALISAVLIPSAQAGDGNRNTMITFKSDRHIVIYATILAIPNYRLKATAKTVMTFRERPAGEPEALRAWFYPGRNWGDEFVYSKAKAMEPAKTANTPVLFTPRFISATTVVTPPPAETAVAMAPEIPATASTLPLISLFGLMAWVRPSPSVASRNAFSSAPRHAETQQNEVTACDRELSPYWRR